MNDVIKRYCKTEENYYIQPNIALSHKRTVSSNEKQPMSIRFNDNTYTICFNGRLYNIDELRSTLKENGFTFDSNSEAEILLKAFIHYGYDTPKHLNGVFAFAIWNEKKQELFLARDHFGIKPLYYSHFDNSCIFASEVKSILAYPNFPVKVDSQGICELVGIGPAHTPRNLHFRWNS